MSLRVVVIGEDPLARGGLAALVAQREELSVVAQGSAREALRLVPLADVVLWDAGTAPVRLDAEDHGGARVLVLAADERQAAQALAEGARGIVPREVSAERLAIALAAIHEGLLVIDEAFADALGARSAPPTRIVDPLTARELEVLALLAEGLANKAIAQRLGISESTAKFHVAAILGKLAVGSRSEAIVQASRLGLVVL